MSISQTESGKAWEYGLAFRCARMFKQASIINNSSRNLAQTYYNALPHVERQKINQAATFFCERDTRLVYARRITIQNDIKGRKGDVRDLIIETESDFIGISAKNRHSALKHPRLSDTIDFGDIWYNIPCSKKY